MFTQLIIMKNLYISYVAKVQSKVHAMAQSVSGCPKPGFDQRPLCMGQIGTETGFVQGCSVFVLRQDHSSDCHSFFVSSETFLS